MRNLDFGRVVNVEDWRALPLWRTQRHHVNLNVAKCTTAHERGRVCEHGSRVGTGAGTSFRGLRHLRGGRLAHVMWPSIPSFLDGSLCG